MGRVAVVGTHAGFGRHAARPGVPRGDDRIAVPSSIREDGQTLLQKRYSEASDRAAKELEYLLSVHPVDAWA